MGGLLVNWLVADHFLTVQRAQITPSKFKSLSVHYVSCGGQVANALDFKPSGSSKVGMVKGMGVKDKETAYLLIGSG